MAKKMTSPELPSSTSGVINELKVEGNVKGSFVDEVYLREDSNFVGFLPTTVKVSDVVSTEGTTIDVVAIETCTENVLRSSDEMTTKEVVWSLLILLKCGKKTG